MTTFEIDDTTPLEEMKFKYIQHVLDKYDGCKTRAAKALGMDRRTLYRAFERNCVSVTGVDAVPHSGVARIVFEESVFDESANQCP